MDKMEKFDYMESTEDYLEQNRVFERFEDLLKQVLVKRPDNPLEFFIEKIKQNAVRRIFLMGLPGSHRKEHMQELAEEFGWKCISSGDVLRKQVAMNAQYANRIQERFDQHSLVDDDIVVDLIKKEI